MRMLLPMLFFSHLLCAQQVGEMPWRQPPEAFSADAYGHFYCIDAAGILLKIDTSGRAVAQLSDIRLAGIKSLEAGWGVRIFAFSASDQTIHWLDRNLGNWQTQILPEDQFVQLAAPASDGGTYVFLPDIWAVAKWNERGEVQWSNSLGKKKPTMLFSQGMGVAVLFDDGTALQFNAQGALAGRFKPKDGERLLGCWQWQWLLDDGKEVFLQSLTGEKALVSQDRAVDWAIGGLYAFGLQPEMIRIFRRP